MTKKTFKLIRKSPDLFRIGMSSDLRDLLAKISRCISLACMLLWILLTVSCDQKQVTLSEKEQYLRPGLGLQTGGVKLIQITTPKGKFHVWTKQIGNNPKIKVLILTGGPGASHEYVECFEKFLPQKGIEFIYYDQLGTGNSAMPKDTALYDLSRSVDEVEQVRKALNLTSDNFYLYGHSWGGVVAIEYALKFQQNLKSLIISDMMSSAADYNDYVKNVLANQIDKEVVKEIKELEKQGDFKNPRFMELLMPNFYAKFFCRLPKWPEPLLRSFKNLNQSFYTIMQGPSEFGISGKLTKWNRKRDLSKIKVPTLTIGAKYDTMDPAHMKWMSTQVQNGTFLYCPNGSHMCLYDDQKVYFDGLTKFINLVDKGDRSIRL
jgi:proline iminopeptidase